MIDRTAWYQTAHPGFRVPGRYTAITSPSTVTAATGSASRPALASGSAQKVDRLRAENADLRRRLATEEARSS